VSSVCLDVTYVSFEVRYLIFGRHGLKVILRMFDIKMTLLKIEFYMGSISFIRATDLSAWSLGFGAFRGTS